MNMVPWPGRTRVATTVPAWGASSISALGAPLYVVSQIAGAPCANEAPAARAYGTGVERAYKTFAGAGPAVLAGDPAFTQAGTYNERLALTQSGAKFQPIRRKRFDAGVVRFKP
jgi:hypothetical protein